MSYCEESRSIQEVFAENQNFEWKNNQKSCKIATVINQVVEDVSNCDFIGFKG